MSTKNRESNIELLRIVSIMGVVLLHYNNASMGGALKYVLEKTANYQILVTLETIFICAVNVFIMITGYFSRHKYEVAFDKPLKLIVQVILFSELKYCFYILIGKATFSFKMFIEYLIPANWFVIIYVTLYFLIPYINLLVNKLSGRELKRLVMVLLGLFSIWPSLVSSLELIMKHEIQGLSSIGMYGSQSGYTIVQFVVVYIIGSCINCLLNTQKWNMEKLTFTKLLGYFIVLIILDVIWSFVDRRTAWAYFNPLVIGEAIIIFLVFMKLPIGNIRIVNMFSEGCFSVFLLHSVFLPYINIENHVNNNPVVLILHLIISIIGIFVICWGAYWIYSRLTDPIWNRIKSHIDLKNDL